jgi:hypothetical protein
MEKSVRFGRKSAWGRQNAVMGPGTIKRALPHHFQEAPLQPRATFVLTLNYISAVLRMNLTKLSDEQKRRPAGLQVARKRGEGWINIRG